MYRTILKNPCNYHVIWESRFETLGFSTSLYLPLCSSCKKHVDVQGVIIGREKMLAEMNARSNGVMRSPS